MNQTATWIIIIVLAIVAIAYAFTTFSAVFDVEKRCDQCLAARCAITYEQQNNIYNMPENLGFNIK